MLKKVNESPVHRRKVPIGQYGSAAYFGEARVPEANLEAPQRPAPFEIPSP